jgi:hypothetical protein
VGPRKRDLYRYDLIGSHPGELAQHLTEQVAEAAFAACIAEPVAIPSMSRPDNMVSRAATPLPSEELDIPNRDVPMGEPLEAGEIREPPEPEGPMRWGALGSPTSLSPRSPTRQDRDEIHEPSLWLE